VQVVGESAPFALKFSNLSVVGEVGVSTLIEQATVWSPASHSLFPQHVRWWAEQAMQIGYLIAGDEERFSDGTAATGLVDCWRSLVLPLVVTREHRVSDAPHVTG